FSWPKEITGLERIALSAKGDLQRVLSAFFDRPIVLALTYSDTFTKRSDNSLAPLSLPNPAAVASASAQSPIVQNRQVHLQCSGKIVCTATSTVKISSPHCAHLFLEEKYGIGQLFAKLGSPPTFELLEVGLGGQNDIEKGFGRGDAQLWRKYRLSVPDFECEILEVFASREMFIGGVSWLDGQHNDQIAASVVRRPTTNSLLWVALLSMIGFELYMYFVNPSRC
ncbi:hypothetical protein B0H19DRAFT_930483, partial [Mycena capillaripes]